MVSWQDVGIFFKKRSRSRTIWVSGSFSFLAVLGYILLLTGMSETHSGDIFCEAECVSYVNITSTYWRVCFSDTFDLVQTDPEIRVEVFVPARGKNNWRLMNFSKDCINRKSEKYFPLPNRFKIVGHKNPEDTVKWSFDPKTPFIRDDVDPLWIGTSENFISLSSFDAVRIFGEAFPNNVILRNVTREVRVNETLVNTSIVFDPDEGENVTVGNATWNGTMLVNKTLKTDTTDDLKSGMWNNSFIVSWSDGGRNVLLFRPYVTVSNSKQTISSLRGLGGEFDFSMENVGGFGNVWVWNYTVPLAVQNLVSDAGLQIASNNDYTIKGTVLKSGALRIDFADILRSPNSSLSKKGLVVGDLKGKRFLVFDPEIILNFISPTVADRTSQDSNLTTINFTVTNTSLVDTAGIEWNGTNFTVFGGGLIGLWHLNNNTQDDSGNGNDGTNIGANCSTNVDGQFGTACDFDGTDDSIDAGDIVIMSGGVTQMSVGAWVNTNTLTGGGGGGNDLRYIVSQEGDGGSGDTFILRFSTTDDNIEFLVKVGTDFVSCADTPTNSISINTWYSVIATFDVSLADADECKIYLNGVPDSTGTGPDANLNSGTTNTIIGDIGPGGRHWSGIIDEVTLWNRALSAEEINITYRSEIGRYYANITDNANGTYDFRAWVNETNGFINFTESRRICIGANFAQDCLNISYQGQTDADNAVVTRNHTFVNLSIVNGTSNIDTVGIEWNGTNITIWGDGLIGLWHLNNNTNDSSGNGNDGTNNGANCSTSVDGQFGTACDFDGGTARIVVADFPRPTRLSVSAWIKTSISSTQQIVGADDVSSGNAERSWQFRLDGPNGIVDFIVFVGGTPFGGAEGTNDLGDGDWHHVFGTYDGETARVYEDGVEVGSDGSMSGDIDGGTGLAISQISDERDDNIQFNGQIDEVRIWNRALSSEEIEILWRSEIGQYFANITENSFTNYSYFGWVNTTNGEYRRTDTRNITFQQAAAAGLLNVTLNGSVFLNVDQNSTVNVSATFLCEGGSCGIVNITIFRSNLLGTTPTDFPVNVTVGGLNFYNTTIMNQSTSSLSSGDIYEYLVFLNATGPFGIYNLTINATNGTHVNGTSFQLNITEPPAVAVDSCSCPGSGDFEVINGDYCFITSLCEIGSNKFRVKDGFMHITGSGTIRAGGCFINDSPSGMFIDDGGGLFCGD